MATVNLGRIKPVFRGAYSGSTAYVVDDIVTHGNESFICIQAHGAGTQATTQTAYWTKLAAKGTDGTDVGTTITTQGDLLYRDGSGLQRLAKGTAGQALKMNSGATAPEWGTAGGVLQAKMVATNDRSSFASNTPVNFTALNMTFTPTKSTSILYLETIIQTSAISTSTCGYFYDNTNSVRVGVGASDGSRQRVNFRGASQHSSAWMVPMWGSAYYALGNTNATDFRIYLGGHGGTTAYVNRSVNHPNNTDVDGAITQSCFKITEYDNSVFTGSGQTNA